MRILNGPSSADHGGTQQRLILQSYRLLVMIVTKNNSVGTEEYIAEFPVTFPHSEKVKVKVKS